MTADIPLRFRYPLTSISVSCKRVTRRVTCCFLFDDWSCVLSLIRAAEVMTPESLGSGDPLHTFLKHGSTAFPRASEPRNPRHFRNIEGGRNSMPERFHAPNRYSCKLRSTNTTSGTFRRQNSVGQSELLHTSSLAWVTGLAGRGHNRGTFCTLRIPWSSTSRQECSRW